MLGFAHAAFYANGPAGWVEEIVVRDGHRRGGAGQAPMAAFEQRAAGRDRRPVALATRRAARSA
ncbi:MAG TPA: GNAT family N-acetyltransferase [Streptosporangiaceae bacterium]|nr:GNAT family N-acetyltransferase [Streptosporangiaceae bacterium]